MNRFFGMMPSSEIEKEKSFIDKSNLKVKIQAGINGWTIVWADGGTDYKDICKSTEENFNEAYHTAVKMIGELNEIKEINCVSRAIII